MTCTSRTSQSVIWRTIAGNLGQARRLRGAKPPGAEHQSPAVCRRPAEHGDEEALRAHLSISSVMSSNDFRGLDFDSKTFATERNSIVEVPQAYGRSAYVGLRFDCLRCAADALHVFASGMRPPHAARRELRC